MSGQMTSSHIRMEWVVLVLLMFTSVHSVLGQKADGTATPVFEDYAFIQYIQSTNLAPANVLKLDNNGDIVLAARGGTTRAQLEASGIPVLDSQIALLKTWRLLEEKDDTIRTLFPVLLPGETRRLRQQIQATAPALADRLVPEIRRLTEELSLAGREENAYTILFSYVLDGMVWSEFEKRGVLDDRAITAETPLWSGEVWALYPPRPFTSGTNSISEAGVSLKVNWTKGAIQTMLPFVADIGTLVRMFDDYRKKGYVEDQRSREVFGPFDLFDETGHFTIPVIVEDASNPLYRWARAIAESAAAEAPVLLDLPVLVSEFGFRDEGQALIVAYHELMWDIIDHLETQGLVQKPTAFGEPKQADPADIAALVFIVRGSE